MITRPKVQKALKRVPSTREAATLAHCVTDKSLMIERSMRNGGEPFYFDSFDIVSATLVSWLIVRKQEYGECQPEALYPMYIFKR